MGKMVLLVLFPAMMFFTACNSHHVNTYSNPKPLFEYSTGSLDFLYIDGSVKTSITIEIADTPETQAGEIWVPTMECCSFLNK